MRSIHRPFVIGVFGRKQHGKSTLARLVASRLPCQVQILSFATPLKQMVREMLNLVGDDMELKQSTEKPPALYFWQMWGYLDQKLVELRLPTLSVSDLLTLSSLFSCPTVGKLYRCALQIVGTEIFRTRDPNIWIKLAQQKIENSHADVFIFDDGRFQNERLWTEKYGLSVGVFRPGLDQNSHQNSEDNHISEAGAEKQARQAQLFRSCPTYQSLERLADEVAETVMKIFPDQGRKT